MKFYPKNVPTYLEFLYYPLGADLLDDDLVVRLPRPLAVRQIQL